MSTMQHIEALAAEYRSARDALTALAGDLREEIQEAERRHVAGIRAAVRTAKEAEAALSAAIDGARGLFERPRTRTVHGMRFGLMKQRGKVEIADETRTLDRIRALLPATQAALLIRVRESVDRQAVGDLTVADLRRLGITVTEDTDQVFVKPADGEVDKLVAALLDGTVEEVTA